MEDGGAGSPPGRTGPGPGPGRWAANMSRQHLSSFILMFQKMLVLYFKTAFFPSPPPLPTMQVLGKSSNSALLFFSNDMIIRQY